jgi:hypothetical protein
MTDPYLKEQCEHVHDEHVCVGQLVGDHQADANVLEGLAVAPQEGEAMQVHVALHRQSF